MRTLVLVAALGLLAACATATPYQPAANGAYGYQEQQIENNRVRISFRGNNLTDRETVETYLLFRAAELTLQNGKDYFVISNRNTDSRSRLQAVGPARPRYLFDYYYYRPRFGWAPWYDPWDEPTDYRQVTRYEAGAEIVMFDGRKPADNPNAFDAREVQANLGNRIVRPPAAG